MQTDSAAIEQLLLIMTQLRDPERGCTWDKVQSIATIAPYTRWRKLMKLLMLLNDKILLL